MDMIFSLCKVRISISLKQHQNVKLSKAKVVPNSQKLNLKQTNYRKDNQYELKGNILLIFVKALF